MALKVPDEGETWLLVELVATILDSASLRLFRSNTTPADNTVIGDLTEANFSGYAAAPLTGLWGAVATVAGRATTVSSLVTFTHNGGGTSNNIYGYYVTDTAGGLLFLERDSAAPVSMASGGDTYAVQVTFTLKSEF